jgi:hypothetical protein
MRPELRITTLDIPFGLTVVTGLNPCSTVLGQELDEVMAEIGTFEYADFGDAELRVLLNVVPPRTLGARRPPRRPSIPVGRRHAARASPCSSHTPPPGVDVDAATTPENLTANMSGMLQHSAISIARCCVLGP